MTETTADTIRTMPPVMLRRWLAVALGYRIYEGERYYGRFVCMKAPSHDYTPEEWAKFWRMTRAYPTAEKAWTGEDVPDWPRSLSDAWSLVLEHCADPDWGADIEIFTRPDGSVLVVDARYHVLSRLRLMEDYGVASYPGLTGPVALADALSRLAALALLERG